MSRSAAEIVGAAALTPLQEGILLHHLQDPDQPDYIVQISGDVDALDEERWRGSWADAIARHAMLRVGVAWKSQARPLQLAFASADWRWRALDWSDRSPEAQQAAFEAFLKADRVEPIDIGRPPLMRGVLIDLGGGRHRFVWTYHHLILDAWSSSLVLDEIVTRYRGGALKAPVAGDLPFKAYVDHLASRDQASARRYWSTALAGASPTPLLAVVEEPRRTSTRRLPPERLDVLNGVCRRGGTTLASLALAAWGVVHAQWTGADRTVIGVSASDRPGDVPSIEALVGPCIATLPLGLRSVSDLSVAEHLAVVQDASVSGRAHGHAPLSRIAAWGGAATVDALFDTLVIFENLPEETGLYRSRGGNPFSNLRSDWRTHYPVSVMIAPGDGLTVQIQAACPDCELEALCAAFLDALDALAADPHRRMRELVAAMSPRPLAPLLTGPERPHFLLQTAPARILAACERCADRPAVVTIDGEMSYAQLGSRIRQLAAGLAAAGVACGDRVAFRLTRSTWLPASLVAVQSLGATCVALDPDLPPDGFRARTAQARATWLLTDRPPEGFVGPNVTTLLIPTLIDRPVRSGLSDRQCLAPDTLAYVIFTSGSTGAPNVVLVEHGALANLIATLAERPGILPDDRVLATTSLGFDIAIAELLAPLCVGASVLLHGAAIADRPVDAVAFIDNAAPTLIQATPSLWRMLLAHGWSGKARIRAWSGGEALDATLAGDILDRVGELWNVYGPTETTVWSTAARVEDPSDIIDIGTPLANTVVVLLTPSGMRTRAGRTGEICIGGAGLARGYDDAALTRERFVEVPIAGKLSRLYRTGDLGRIEPDGTLVCLGRADRQLKIGGARVEPGEIEGCLRTVAGVAAATVIGISAAPGAPLELAAFLQTASDGPELDLAAIRNALERRLPAALVPRRFIKLAALPLSLNGKLDEKALQRLALAQDPGQASLAGGAPVLDVVLQILRGVLERPTLGPCDDFQAFGGDSLLALRVVARINQACGVTLRPVTVIERSRAVDLAAVVSNALATGPGPHPFVRDRSGSPPPLTDEQRQLLYLGLDRNGSSPYHLIAAIDSGTFLEPDRLQHAVDALVARNEILRTAFHASADGGRQHILPHATVEVGIVSVGENENMEGALERLAAASAARPFDRACPPLLRLQLIRRPGRSDAVMLSVDHIVADAWSIRLMFLGLLALYEMLPDPTATGSPNDLQFGDFARWRAQAPPADRVAADTEYWRNKLAGMPRSGLALDRPRPNRPRFEAGNVFLALSSPQALALHQLAAGLSASLFCVLLATYRVLLLRTMGEGRTGVGTMLSGRDHPELEQMLGFFARTAVLDNSIGAEMTFAQIVRNERQTLLDAWRHQSIGFGDIVALHRRTGQEEPLFRTMLVTYGRAMPPARNGAARFVSLAPQFVECDLIVRCYETGEGLDVCFSYDNALFDPATVSRMSRLFGLLLSLVARCPDLPVGRLPLDRGEDATTRAFLAPQEMASG